MAHRDERTQPHFAFVLGHASLSVNGNPSNSKTGSIVSHGGTPDTVIYDASFSQNAKFAVEKKREEA